MGQYDDLRKQFGIQPATTPAASGDLTVPQVPPQKVPRAEEAESEYIRTARDSYALTNPGPVASELAMRTAEKLRAKPADIPAEPSLLQEAGIALTPTQMRGDARPSSPASVGKYVAQRAAQTAVGTALSLVDPLQINPVANSVRDLTQPDAEKGLPTENEILWALRVFGTATPAVIQATIERAPAPGMTGAAEALSQGDMALAATRFFTPSTLGEQLLDVDPNSQIRVQRGNAMANWAEDVLERIEEGRGLETDFARSAEARLGPGHPYLVGAAEALGFGIDALTDWEGSVVHGGHVVAEIARTSSALKDVAPEMSRAARLWAALRGAEIDSDWYASKLIRKLEDEGGSISDLPAPIRARAEQVALAEDEQSLHEVAQLSGVGHAREVPVSDLGYQHELDAAKRAAYEATPGQPVVVNGREVKLTAPVGDGIPGITPGAFGPRMVKETRAERAARSAERPLLPAFTRRGGKPWIPSTASDWFRALKDTFVREPYPPGGYRIPRGEGFRRLSGAEEMTVDRATYVLRDHLGDVKRVGTFEQVANTLLRRQMDGDSIWDADVRPVAGWSKKGKPRLSADYFFASPVEERLVSVWRESDPRAIPGRLRALRDAKAATAETIAGRILADSVTDAPASGAPRTRLGEIVQDATRLAFRDVSGSDRLKMLPNMAMVAPGDRKLFLDGMQKRIGIPVERARAIIGGATATAEEEAKLGELARRAGIDRKPGTLTTTQWNQMRRQALRDVGGVLADVRYRVEGVRPMVDRMFQAIADLHLDRRKYGALGKAFQTRGPFAWVSKMFLEDPHAPMPGPVKALWKEAKVRLERVADDLALEFKALPNDMSPAAKIQSLIGRFLVVHPEDLARASDVFDQAALQAEWKGPRPWWLDQEDAMLARHGWLSWRKNLIKEAAASGRSWLKSILTAAGEKVGRNLLADEVETQVPPELAQALYLEAFQDGNLNGPALKEALHALRMDGIEWDSKDALVAHALRLKSESILGEELDRLSDAGVTVAQGDVRKRAIEAVVKGNHREWNPTLRRWEYAFPQGQITWALERVRDWGVDVGSRASTAERTIAGRRVVLPEYLVDELERMVASGQVDSRQVYKSKPLNELVRHFKEWTTHGIILPNPAFFTGQMLSVVPTIVTTEGLRGAAEAGSALVRHPGFVGSLAMRLAGGGSPTFHARNPGDWLLQTATGDILSLDDMEHIARLHGLQDTRTSFETAESLKSVLAEGGEGWMDFRRLAMPVRWWQNQIRYFSGSFDLVGRLSVFVAHLEQGMPPAEAAAAARAAVLDFRALTDAEAKTWRKVFTFYAFLRKNADAYVRALVHNPGAVFSQMRVADASIRHGLTALEQGALSNDDMGRLTLYSDEQVVDDHGRPNPLYRMTRLQTTPMGVPEFLGNIRILTGLMGITDSKQALQQITPLGQALAILTLGRRLDKEFDAPLANRIPPVLMDTFMAPWIRKAFGVGPVAIRETDDPLTADEDASNELGTRAVWAAGGDRALTPEQAAAGRKAWQMFLTWFGRPLGTVESLAQAFGAEDPPPYITTPQAMAAMLGLKWRPVLTEAEAKRRGLLEREYRFRDATDAVKIPEHRPTR